MRFHDVHGILKGFALDLVKVTDGVLVLIPRLGHFVFLFKSLVVSLRMGGFCPAARLQA